MKNFDFSRLLSQLMGMLPILVVIAGIFLVYTLFKKGVLSTVGGLLFGNDKSNSDFVSDSVDSLDRAKVIAANLLTAMNRIGTDEVAIDVAYSSLKNDFNLARQVFKAFGVRRYDKILGTQSYFIGSDENLYGWLSYELSKKDLIKWTSLFQSIGLA